VSDEDFEDYVGGSESGEKDFNDRIHSYQEETGLTKAIQIGTSEKITQLIEYAAKNFLPVILVCASGGARM